MQDSSTPPAPADHHRRILVLFAHPSLERSEARTCRWPRPRAPSTASRPGGPVRGVFRPSRSTWIGSRHGCARRVICFLHPLYWYSTPAILKEWQDLVLEHGFAYGSEGTALHGKLFFNALTAGGAEAAYCAEGHNHFAIPRIAAAGADRDVLGGITYPAAVCAVRRACTPWWRRGASRPTRPIGRDCSRRCVTIGWTSSEPPRCRGSIST